MADWAEGWGCRPHRSSFHLIDRNAPASCSTEVGGKAFCIRKRPQGTHCVPVSQSLYRIRRPTCTKYCRPHRSSPGIHTCDRAGLALASQTLVSSSFLSSLDSQFNHTASYTFPARPWTRIEALRKEKHPGQCLLGPATIAAAQACSNPGSSCY